MITVSIPEREWYDEKTECFFKTPGGVLQLEHSLVSLSKWESKWKKPFLDKRTEKTTEETIDYIRCMTINHNVSQDVYTYIPADVMDKINKYISDSMTATWFNEAEGTNAIGTRETITAEIIYYWMISLNIPFECQKWHLNRLMTLIKVCNIKNQPDKKMSKGDIMRRNAKLNAARKAKYHSKG